MTDASFAGAEFSTDVEERTPAADLFAKIILIAATFFYATALAVAHATSLSYRWQYLGFTYYPPGAAEIILGVVMIAATALSVPPRINRPSEIVLQLLFLSVVVPTIVITLGLRPGAIATYGLALVALCIAFTIGSRGSTRAAAKSDSTVGALPSDTAMFAFIGIWTLCTAVLIFQYASIMTFASIDEIYEQRFNVDRGITALGYVRTYYLGVFSPALIAFGLMKRNYGVLLLGVAGCVVSYLIDAQKTALILPVVMLGFYATTLTRRSLHIGALLALFLASAVWISLIFADNAIGSFIDGFIVHRLIATPGLVLSQYYDLFSNYGYTWWSNVSGVSLVVPAPPAFAQDPDWPSLGNVVGKYYFGPLSNLNQNANLFAGDGIAASGPFGVIVVGIVLAFWLKFVDIVVEGWNTTFTILLILPVGVALTNGHFTTVFLSFGGGFWLLYFALIKPGRVTSEQP